MRSHLTSINLNSALLGIVITMLAWFCKREIDIVDVLSVNNITYGIQITNTISRVDKIENAYISRPEFTHFKQDLEPKMAPIVPK